MNKQSLHILIFVLTLLVFGLSTATAQDAASVSSSISNSSSPYGPENNPYYKSQNSLPNTTRQTSEMSNTDFRKNYLANLTETSLKVLKVFDGNTLQVGNSKGKQWVRLLGVDAPEIEQNGGLEAKTELDKLIGGKSVVIEYSTFRVSDADGIYLARVVVDGKDIGLSLIENGFAWFDDAYKYFFSKAIAVKNTDAQKRAAKAKIGIWKEAKPLPPWKFRDEKFEEMKRAKNKTDGN